MTKIEQLLEVMSKAEASELLKLTDTDIAMIKLVKGPVEVMTNDE